MQTTRMRTRFERLPVCSVLTIRRPSIRAGAPPAWGHGHERRRPTGLLSFIAGPLPGAGRATLRIGRQRPTMVASTRAGLRRPDGSPGAYRRGALFGSAVYEGRGWLPAVPCGPASIWLRCAGVWGHQGSQGHVEGRPVRPALGARSPMSGHPMSWRRFAPFRERGCRRAALLFRLLRSSGAKRAALTLGLRPGPTRREEADRRKRRPARRRYSYGSR